MKKTIILVTGGSGDIGAAIVTQLSHAKKNIVCLHYSKNKERALMIMQGKENVFLFHQDFFDDLHLIDDVIKKFGRIDVLINCAGILGIDTIFDLTSEEFDHIFHFNTKVPYLLSSNAFKYMKTNNYGRIVNISSIAVSYGMGRNTTIQYAGSKAALESLTVGLSSIGAQYNILVNTIRPGVIESEMQTQRPGLEQRIKKIPLKRMGRPEEIAAMVSFLISHNGDFITGQTITIGGGE